MIGDIWAILTQQQVQSAIAVWGGITGTHSFIGGLKASSNMQLLLREMELINARIDRLSGNVYSAPNSLVVTPASVTRVSGAGSTDGINLGSSSTIQDPAEALAREARADLLTSAVIYTPEKFQRVFKNNPQDILLGVRKVSDPLRAPKDKDLIPVLFQDASGHFVGWQKRSVLEHTFDIRIDELEWKSLAQVIMPSVSELKSPNLDLGPVGSPKKDAIAVIQCPQCKSMFRFSTDQLLVADGFVRCGHCADVFDGKLHQSLYVV